MPVKKRRRILTDFGTETYLFARKNGMSLKEMAAAAGVNYNTFNDVRTDRCTGHELVPKVIEFMANYANKAEAGAQ